MLAGSNDKILLANGIDEKYIYFYQVWQELLDPRTLDVYQYRVMNSFTALSEIQSVIEKTITGLFTSDANIETMPEH